MLVAEGVQRLAHMAPKRRRSIRDPCRELLVGTGDVLPKVEAGDIRAPASLRALVGHVLHACGALVTGTREHFVHALTRDAERTGKQPCLDGRPCPILARVSSELRSPLRERARMTAELDRVKAASRRIQNVTVGRVDRGLNSRRASPPYKSGASTRQIAGVAGISHARVFQIISEP